MPIGMVACLLLTLASPAANAADDARAAFDHYVTQLEQQTEARQPRAGRPYRDNKPLDHYLDPNANIRRFHVPPERGTDLGDDIYDRGMERARACIEHQQYAQAIELIEMALPYGTPSDDNRQRLNKQLEVLRRWTTLDRIPLDELREFYVRTNPGFNTGPLVVQLWRDPGYEPIAKQWLIYELLGKHDFSVKENGHYVNGAELALKLIPTLDNVSDQDATTALLNLGARCYKAGRTDEAEQYWQRVQDYPITGANRHAAMYNLGILEKDRQHYRRAIDIFQQLIDDKPDDRDPTGYLMNPYRNYAHHACEEISHCYEAMGDYSAALHHHRLGKTAYPYQTGCGTCRNAERWQYRKRATYLFAMAYGPESGLTLILLAALLWRRRKRHRESTAAVTASDAQ